MFPEKAIFDRFATLAQLPNKNLGRNSASEVINVLPWGRKFRNHQNLLVHIIFQLTTY